MKRTGPTNIRTRALVVHLEKHAKKTKEGAYSVLSEMMNTPARIRAEVNLYHLDEMAATHKDKIFVVPGSILAKGEINHAVEVAALRYSGTAKKKIEAAKGKAWLLEELVDQKVPAKKLVLVK